MIKFLIIVSTGFLLTSCFNIFNPPPPQPVISSSRVSIINHKPSAKCRYLGELFGYKHHYAGMFDLFKMKQKNIRNYEIKLKNQVALLNGNTAVLLKADHGRARDIEMYSVYRC